MVEHLTPVQMLMQRAARSPNQIYLHQPVADGSWQTYTWAETALQAQKMATALLGLGLAPGDRIAITGLNTAHWFLADFACAMAGLVSVGLYPKQAADSVRYIAEHSAIKAVFVGPMPDAEGLLGALPKGLIRIGFPYPGVPECDYQWDALTTGYPPISPLHQRAEDEPLSLIYTSGTTGHPKGVIITTSKVKITGYGMMRGMPPEPNGEHLLSYLPLAHAFERGAVAVSSVYLGAEVWFLASADKLAETLKHVRPTRFYAVPLVWARLQAGISQLIGPPWLNVLLRIPGVSGFVKRKISKGLGLDRAWLRVSGAAPLPAATWKFFQHIGLGIFEGYGMTENSIYVSCNLPGADRGGSVGKPYPDSSVRIAEDGEILNRHDGVTLGYFGEPEKTREIFTDDGWLRTGDMGRLDKDGFLYVTGRMKESFKTLKGKYVTPSPIEGAFSANTDVDHLCLIGSGLHQPVMAVCLTTAARAKSKSEIEKSLLATLATVNASLEAHEAVAKIVIAKQPWSIDNQMLTPTFKVRRMIVEAKLIDLIRDYENRREIKVVWEP